MKAKAPLVLIIAAFLFLSNSLAAQSSLLWKVSGSDIRDSWLFGTIHLLCPDDLTFSDPMKSALTSSEQLVLELDFDDPAMFTDIQKYVMMDEGTLRDLLTEEEYIRLSQFFQEKMGMPLDAIPKIKPFMLMSMMMPAMLDCQPASFEMELVKMAKEKEMEVIGLETVQEQMSAVDSFSQEQMADMLMDYLENVDNTKEDFASMVAAYKKQDPDLLLVEMDEQLAESGMENFNEIMLDQRNVRWIDRIGIIAAEKSTFFAVGAGHLGGEMGVIELLRKAGYTVTPIPQ